MSEPRRIRPPKDSEKLIDRLVEEGVFESKQAVMMFAAALGRRFAGRKPLGAPGDGIRWHIFEKGGDEAFVNALALVDRSNIEVLDPEGSEDEVAAIFEEYAAAGFSYLKEHVVDTPGDLLDNCLAVIQRFRASQEGSPPGLEGLDRSTLKLLGDMGQ